MVVAAVLKARSFRNICFVTDSVLEPVPGARVKYMDRQCKQVLMLYCCHSHQSHD